MQDKLKDSKVSRHEQAKEKFRLFERSHSTNSLNKKSQFIPVPGQFVIQTKNKNKKQEATEIELPKINKKQSIRFTTNLKLIVKEKSPQMVSQTLNNVVNHKIQSKSLKKKIHRSQSTGSLRPLTAQIYSDTNEEKNLNQSRLVLDAASYDKKNYFKQQFSKKNTFMVKSRSQIPRHGYGYNALKLEKQKKLKIEQIPTKFHKIQEQNSYDQITKFLPIEYYLIGDEKPEQLIKKYQITQNVMVGYSKWYDLNGEFGWKKCRIIGYRKDKQRWEIQWLHNCKRKLVSRNNLYFQNQNHQNFQKIVQNAQQCRKKSQVFMKYNLLIDLMKSPTNQLSEQQTSRILKLVLGKQFLKDSIINTKNNYAKLVNNPEKLITQIKQKYIRANHQVQFNASLPYNQKHKEQFMQFLPQHLFKPSTQYKNPQINESVSGQIIEKKVKISCEFKQFFKQNSKKFKQKSSLVSLHRIQIIQFLNTFELQMNQKQFFKFYQSKYYKMEDISLIFQKGLAQMLSKINCAVCDIQHWVGKQLDITYANKKMIGQAQFNKLVQNYTKFLYMINYRMQVIARKMLTRMMAQFNQLFDYQQKLSDYLKDVVSTKPAQDNINNDNLQQQQSSTKYDNNNKDNSKNKDVFDKIKILKKIPNLLKVKIQIQVKDNKIQSSPRYNEIGKLFTKFIQKTFSQFSNLTCISKSYLQEIRPRNKMSILNDLKNQQIYNLHPEVYEAKTKLYSSIEESNDLFESFFRQIQKIISTIFNIQTELKKKQQKKCSYSDLDEFIYQIQENQKIIKKLSLANGKNVSAKLKVEEQCQQILTSICKNTDAKLTFQTQKVINFSIYSTNIQQVQAKSQIKNVQIRKQVYKTALQKIIKQNQKLQKQIQNVILNLEKQPKDITQMISLEIYANQTACQQLININQKILQISEKVKLLQKTNQEFDFRDFQACYRIYLKPIKIRSTISARIKDIEHDYKKNFGQALNKSSADLLTEIKDIQQKFEECTKIDDINQMHSSFLIYSKLKQRIQKAEIQMNKINSYQNAMKWITTNFQRLNEIKQDFMPYYRLISLEKNFKYHIETQLSQGLHSIDPVKLTEEVNSGLNQLNHLQFNVFKNNLTILDIVKQVNQSYTSFKSKLPLIQILRNADLRQRHWNSIKQLTKFTDILSQKITLNELLSRGIKKHQKNLIQISQIATRELIYEKKLNKMKKEWKDIRVNIQKPIEQTHEDIRIITNLDEVQQKVQKDIYHVQQILSSSFIKFLQKDILNWKNLYLYKIYEFVQIWRKLQKDITQILYMFARPQLKIQAKNQYQKFKLIQKNWKSVIVLIQQQPNIVQLLQTKILQSIRYILELIQQIQKVINNFFQKKKQRFSRFGSLSEEELIKLFANSQKQEEQQNFDMSVRKCLHGVKNIGRNKSNQITSVMTHLDQSIQFQQAIQSYREGQKVMPDKLIEQIEKKIKKSLRSSIDLIDKAAQNKILQIVLLHQRLVFTRQIESQILDQGVTEAYVNTLDILKSKIVQVIIESGKNFKTQAELTQLINHCRIAELLYRQEVTQICDFHWISQIRTYQKNQTYLVELGLNQAEYGFQIIDYQEYIVQCNTQKMFLNFGLAISERMFTCIRSDYGKGKLSSIHYLASIHGRNQNILNGHKAISYQNIIDYLRMAATGIWIVFNNINFFSQQTLSAFNQNSQIFWFNFRNSKGKSSFNIGNRFISLSSLDLGLFCTITTTNNSGHQKICDKISQYYRIYSITKIDLKYIIQCKLLLQGFIKSDFRRLAMMVQLIKNQLEFYCQNYRKTKKTNLQNSISVFSQLNFVSKIIKTAKSIKDKIKNSSLQQDLILQAALQDHIQELIQDNDILKEQIFIKLKTYYKFISIQNINQMKDQESSDLSDEAFIQAHKNIFIAKRLYFNKEIIRNYLQIVETVQNKHSAIVLGSQSTGKSTLIELVNKPKLIHDKDSVVKNIQQKRHYRLRLRYVYPYAYSLNNLYGDATHNGIINNLIKVQDQNQNNNQKQKQKDQNGQKSQQKSQYQQELSQYGIVFDGNIKEWIQPLVPLIKNSTIYIQPNGKSLILDKPFKLIFECRQIADVSPSILLSTTIIYLKSQLKWQNIFNSFIIKNFNQRYHKSCFLTYVQSFVSFLIQPIFQFFTNSLKTSKNDFIFHRNSKCFSNLVNLIPAILNLFKAILDNHYAQSYRFQTLQSKEKSQILNIFIMALTWTVGLYIPQESKKSFSRHFKYIIKRVVQVNIKSVQKETLPKEQDDIYEIYYSNNNWKLWSQLQSGWRYSAQKIDKLSVQLVDHNKRYFYLMQRYTQQLAPFFLIGGQSTNKNTIMKMFLNMTNKQNNQTHNKILMACTPNSSHFDAKRLIVKQIQKQKYSHAFQGFVHGKSTLFYICDLNLPLTKSKNNSLEEFIHQYFMAKGWYIEQDSDRFNFKNIIFCGTLNSNYNFQSHLFKHLNLMPYIQSQKQFKSSLLTIFGQQTNLIPFQQNLAQLMLNLQDVVKRQYSNKFFLSFQKKDLYDIAQGICKLNRVIQNNIELDEKQRKLILLQKWVYQSQKKYMERFGPNYNWQKMFYFINNVLMQQERLRYKILFKQYHAIVTNISYYLSRHNNSSLSNSINNSKQNSMKVLNQKQYPQGNRNNINNIKYYEILQNTEGLSKTIKHTIQEDIKINNDYIESQQKNQDLRNREMLYSQIDESSIKFMADLLDKLQNKSQIIFCLENIKQNMSTSFNSNNFEENKQGYDYDNSTSSKRILAHSKFKFEPLITMCCSITQKSIIRYEPNQLSDTYVQWKFFITQIFELIWSSQNYNKQYLIVLQNLSQAQEHIIQDLLQLKRLQTFALLQDFIKNQELENDEMMQNMSEMSKSQRSGTNRNLNSDRSSQKSSYGEQNNENLRDQVVQTQTDNNTKPQKLNIQKVILSRINFVVMVTDPEFQQRFIIDNYSILIQKCSIFWLQNYVSYVHGLESQKLKNTLTSKKSLKQLTSTYKLQDTPQDQNIEPLHQSKSQLNNLDQKLLSRLEKVSGLLYQPLNIQQIHKIYKFFKNLKQKQELSATSVFNGKDKKAQSSQKQIQDELQEEYTYEFLQFVQLFHNFTKIIKQKITKRSLRIRENLLNLQHLKNNCSTINEEIKQNKIKLQFNQNKLLQVNEQLQKYTLQYQRYENTHKKINQSSEIIQKYMTQLVQMYNKSVFLQKKHFQQTKAELVELLKNGKQKKILSTNEIKICLQILGAIIGKKLKPQESMNRQIAKDVNSLKVHKKIQNVDFQINQISNLSQKTLQKLHQLMSNNYVKAVQNKNQKESYNQKLIYFIKNFTIALLRLYEVNQKEEISQFRKNISKLQKQAEHLKLQEEKNFKNKNYQNFLSKYQKTNIQQKQLSKICAKINADILHLSQTLTVSEKIKNIKIFIKRDSQKEQVDQIQIHIQIEKQYEKQLNQLLKIHEAHPIISSILSIKMYFQLSQNSISQLWHMDLFQKKQIDQFMIISLKQWKNIASFNMYSDQQKSEQHSTKKTSLLCQNDQKIENNNLNTFNTLDNLELLTGFVFIQEPSSNVQFFNDLLKINSIDFDTFVNYLQILKCNFLQKCNQRQKTEHVIKDQCNKNQNTTIKQIVENKSQSQNQGKNQKNLISENLKQTSQNKIQIIFSKQVVISNNFLNQNSNSNQRLQNTLCCLKISCEQQIQVILNLMETIQSQIGSSLYDFCQNSKFIIIIDKQLKQTIQKSQYRCLLIEQNQEASNHFKDMQKLIEEDLNIQKKQIQQKKLTQLLNLKLSLETRQVEIQNCINSYSKFEKNVEYYFDSSFNLFLHNFLKKLIQRSEVKEELSEFPVINSRKKSNSVGEKIAKFCVKVYIGIILLQKRRLIPFILNYQKYVLMIHKIIQRQKQNQKKINLLKFGKVFKCALWDHLATFNIKYKKYLTVVFSIAWNADFMKAVQFQNYLDLIIEIQSFSLNLIEMQKRFNQNSNKIQNKDLLLDSLQTNLLCIFMTNEAVITDQATKKTKKQFKISEDLKKMLIRLQTMLKNFKNIYQFVNRDKLIWFNFFNTLSQNTLCLPEPFHDQNKIFIGLFVSLLKPKNLYRWLKLNDEDNVLNITQYQNQDCNQLMNFTIQRQILKAIKLQYKYLYLIGNNNLAKVYDLAMNAKKQLRIISKLDSEKKTKSGVQSLMNSQNVTRKDIANGNFVLMTAKFQQNLVQQIHNTMKSSGWLFINMDNLPELIQNQSKFEYLKTLIAKNTKGCDENKDQQQPSLNNSINSFSSTNLKSSANFTSVINMNMYQNSQYLIILSSQEDSFTIPNIKQKKSNNKIETVLNLDKNKPQINSCIVRTNDTTFTSETSFITNNWHQMVSLTKKGIKDYQLISPYIKALILQTCQHLQYSIDRIKKLKNQNHGQKGSDPYKSIISQIINKAFRIFNIVSTQKNDRKYFQSQTSQKQINSIIITNQNIKKKNSPVLSQFYHNQLNKKQSNKQKAVQISIQSKKAPESASDEQIRHNHFLNLVYHYISSSINDEEVLYGFQKLWKFFLTQNKYKKYAKMFIPTHSSSSSQLITDYIKQKTANLSTFPQAQCSQQQCLITVKQIKFNRIQKIRTCIKKVNIMNVAYNHSQSNAQSQSQQLFPLITSITEIKSKLEQQISKYEQQYAAYDPLINKNQVSTKFSSGNQSKISDDFTINDLKMRFLQKLNQGVDQKDKKIKQRAQHSPNYKLLRSQHYYKIQLLKAIEKNYKIAALIKSLCKFADCKDKEINTKYEELYDLIVTNKTTYDFQQLIMTNIIKIQDELQYNVKIYHQVRNLDRLIIDKCIFFTAQNVPEYSLTYIHQISNFLNIVKQVFVDKQKVPYQSVRLILAFNDKKIKQNSKPLNLLCYFSGFSLFNLKKIESFLYSNHIVFDENPNLGFDKSQNQGLKMQVYAQVTIQMNQIIDNDEQECSQEEILLTKKIIKVPLLSRKQIKNGIKQGQTHESVYIQLQKVSDSQFGLQPFFICY